MPNLMLFLKGKQLTQLPSLSSSLFYIACVWMGKDNSCTQQRDSREK